MLLVHHRRSFNGFSHWICWNCLGGINSILLKISLNWCFHEYDDDGSGGGGWWCQTHRSKMCHRSSIVLNCEGHSIRFSSSSLHSVSRACGWWEGLVKQEETNLTGIDMFHRGIKHLIWKTTPKCFNSSFLTASFYYILFKHGMSCFSSPQSCKNKSFPVGT